MSPYLQPGNASSLSREQKVIIWQTDSIPGEYEVICTSASDPSGKPVRSKVTSDELRLNNVTTHLYRATLTSLDFDQKYSYQIKLNGKAIASGEFETRTKGNKTKFAVFGDCGVGSPSQAKIANQIYKQKPQFALVTGDMVYSYGREAEYRVRFFPYYNTKAAAPNQGAPLMSSIPFYMLLGNHDIYSANFDKHPDGLAYFYYSDLPLNAPITKYTVEAEGNSELVKAFKRNTGSRFPKMANFSFDYGNVHITCIDANSYINPLDPALIEWLTNDIRSSKADWKILAYHHPGFNSSPTHYDYQIMRILAPITEDLGVDLVLSGHVHNYQRTLPLKFAPKKDASNNYTISEVGRVDGTFTLDTKYDGVSNTKPDGIIYLVSGAGGAALYDDKISEKPELWKKGPPENWAPFTARLVSHIHSFTIIETDGKKLTIKQIDSDGSVFDSITVTK